MASRALPGRRDTAKKKREGNVRGALWACGARRLARRGVACGPPLGCLRRARSGNVRCARGLAVRAAPGSVACFARAQALWSLTAAFCVPSSIEQGVAVKDFIPPAKSRMQPKPKCLLVFDSARKPGYQIKFITANPRQAKQWAVGSTLAADGVSPTDLMVETDGGGLGGNILAKRTSTSVLIESEGDAAQKSKLLEAMKADKADEDEDEDDEEEDAEEEEDEVGSPLPGTASSAPIASAGGANAQIVQVAKPMSGAQLALLVFGVLVLMVLADKLDICENSYRLVAPLVEDPRGFLLAIPARLRSVAVALPSTVRWLVMRLVSLVRRGVLGAPAAIKGFVTQLLTGLVWLVRNSGRLLKGSVGKAYSTVVAARSRAVQALDKVLEKSITSLVKMKK